MTIHDLDVNMSLVSHSAAGPAMSSVTDSNFFHALGKIFDPHNSNGLTSRQTTLYNAMTSRVAPKQLKEITSDEQTAVKTYLTAYMSLRQDLNAKCVHKHFCPVHVASLADAAGKDVLSIDDMDKLMTYLGNLKLISIPALDTLIDEINLVYEAETPDTIRELPGSYLALWVPSHTLSEMRTLATTCATNEHLARSALEKAGIAVRPFTITPFENFTPRIKTMGRDKEDMFWKSHAWIAKYNATIRYLFALTDATTGLPSLIANAPGTSSNFLSSIYYVYKKGVGPSALHNLVRWFYFYDATANPQGCTRLADTDGSNYDEAGAIANNEMYCFRIGKTGTQPAWVTNAQFAPVWSDVMELIFADNNTYSCYVDLLDSGSVNLEAVTKLRPDEKKVDFDVSFDTNYGREFAYFVGLFMGVKGPKGYKKGKADPDAQKKIDINLGKREAEV